MGRVVATAMVVAGVLAGAVATLSLLARLRQTYGDADSETFDLVAVGRGRRVVNRAERFAGGTVLAVCGAILIDLREARIDAMGAYIAIDCWLGSVEIVVPAGWQVVMHRTEWLGGRATVDIDALPGSPDDRPTLEVEARVFAGTTHVRVAERRDVTRVGSGSAAATA